MNDFRCIGCGLCCTKVGNVLASKGHNSKYLDGLIEEFPYSADENGVCEKLDRETNQCTVYEDRPTICRVDQMWEEHYSKNDAALRGRYSKKRYNEVTKEACITLQKDAGWSHQKIEKEWK